MRNRTTPYLIYAAGVFVVGALATYPVYLLIATAGWDVEFHRLLIKVLKVAALLGLLPLLIALGAGARRIWGYGGNAEVFTQQLIVGLAIGIASLLWLYLALWVLDIRVFKPMDDWSASALASLAAKALATGLVVAVLEETWFRGALQGSLRRTHSALTALLAPALLYALVHFIRADHPLADPPNLFSGLAMLPQLFERLGNPGTVADFAALLAAGLWLGLMRRHTGNIAQAIGVHAGWVMIIKIGRKTTEADPDAAFSGLVGGYNGVLGWLACAWFSVLAASYYFTYLKRPR